MSDLSRLACLSLLLALPAAADQLEPSQLPPERGVYVGARASYGFPLGRFNAKPDQTFLSDSYDGSLPLQLDLGYRFNRYVRAGAYASYALVKPSSFCVDCRASSVRYGVSAELHVTPEMSTDAWAGLSAGYEQSALLTTQKGTEVESRYTGLELFALQGGADYRLAPNWSLGPTLTWTFARYSTLHARIGDGQGSESVQNRALHCWMMFGARVQAAF
ncbi:hypothetical protein FGE12_05240 [Aggregicoccus sp. 17bor-14]|uniref:outer membrane beta-barrel protein n=1 Tax=Myxococcaceae TaxID=31 RepID=UPI00129C7F92|nr:MULTISPECIES: hypothetical protein [Myxococcaceae]MBF5041785.1 hypothetical protein [Simulacricoccus sp. 17bor-14]MRI87566.1 hypothetical protein [Aggregicoccus sp. 17bor-14]